MFLFIGYDGQYYLDSSDWKKEVPLGSVFDVSFVDTLLPKLARVRSRDPCASPAAWTQPIGWPMRCADKPHIRNT